MDWRFEVGQIVSLLSGIKITHVIGGVSAGLVRLFFVGGGFVSGLVSTLVGLIITLNLSPSAYFVLVHYFPWADDPRTEHSVVFFVGIIGLFGCEGLIKKAKEWKDDPKFPGGLKP